MELNQKSEAETLSNLIGKMRGKGSRKRSRNDTAATQQTPAKHSKVDGSCQTENTVEQVRLFDDDESDNPADEDSDSEVEEYSGMEQPPLIKQLKTILAEYPDDGQIIKELVQNAEDAGASEMKILYDGRRLNTEIARKIPYRKFFKAPALCFYNNGVFSEDDWRGIKMIYSSVKEEDPLKVGRFGLGFKSVFHITGKAGDDTSPKSATPEKQDNPCIISGHKILLMNPHEKVPDKVCITMKLTALRKCKRLKLEEFLEAVNGTFGFSSDSLDTGRFEGTIFWFPLRETLPGTDSDQNKILSDTFYDGSKVLDLFKSFQTEATHTLLFLKSLCKVEIYCRGSETDYDLPDGEPFFTVKLEDDDNTVRQERQRFLQEVKAICGSIPKDDIVCEVRPTLKTRNKFFGLATDEKKSSWLVINIYKGGNMSEKLQKLVSDKDLSYLPFVGAAVPLTTSAEPFKGHIFCFLPLPQEKKSLTGLPIHFNGFFALSQNRRHLKWASADQETLHMHRDKAIEWNECLVNEVIPSVYLRLIKEMIAISNNQNNTGQTVAAVYSCIPDDSAVDMKWEGCVKELYKQLFGTAFIFLQKQSRWVLPFQPLYTMFYKQKIPCEQQENVIQLLNLHTNVESTKVPMHIWKLLRKVCLLKKMPYPNDISPTELCKVMRSENIYRHKTDRSHKIKLLEYIVKDRDFEILQGLELIPLENGSFVTFHNSEEVSTLVYFCTEDEIALFPGLEERFVSTDISAQLKEVFRNLVRSGKYQIRDLSATDAVRLLEITIRQKFGNMEPICLKPSSDRIFQDWLENLWAYIFNHFSNALSYFVNLPLIPCLVKGKWDAGTWKREKVQLYKMNHTFLVKGSRDQDELPDSICNALERLSVKILPSLPEWLDAGKIPCLFISNGVSVVRMLEQLSLTAQCIGDYNSKCQLSDAEAMVVLIEKISSSLTPKAIKFLQRLKLFKETVSVTDQNHIALCSIADNSHIVHHNVSIPVRFPRRLLVSNSFVCLSVAKKLDAYEVSEYHLVTEILQAINRNSYNDNEVRTFMIWFLTHIYKFESKPNILSLAGNIAFVPNGDRRQIPSELYDPRNESLKSLFSGECKFPIQEFCEESHLNSLKYLGLRSRGDVTADCLYATAIQLNSMCEQNLDRTYYEKKAKSFLQILEEKHELLCSRVVATDHQLHTSILHLKCLPHKKEKPDAYPRNLIWKGTKFTLCSPSELRSVKFSEIAGSVIPLIKFNSRNVGEYFSWNLPPEAKLLVQQLKNLISAYNGTNKSLLLPLLFRVYDAMANTTSGLFSYPVFQDFLSGNCVWWGDGFCPPNQTVLEKRKEDIDLRPYMFTLPTEMESLKSFFCSVGCHEMQNVTIFLKVLDLIDSKYKVKGVADSDEVRKDLSIVLQVLIKLCQDNVSPEQYGEKVLFPVHTGDERTLVLKPYTQCTYCDAQWLKEMTEEDEDDDQILYVHADVPSKVAECLRVKSLKRHLMSDAEGLEEWGQEEPLTRRLHNILKDGYVDGLAVPKEIIQNADDARASKVHFVYDERQNADARTQLLDEAMADCQGPALWAYNDALFTESDLRNITKLSGATKESDTRKIGKFGLGFCAVYNLTDVPSFLSGQNMVIFDPHTKYLNRALPGHSPGLKINLKTMKNKRLMKKMHNQFKPFQNVVGCDLLQSDPYFNGTLFRLPLRTKQQAAVSEIKDTSYNRKEMLLLLKQFVEACGNMLLFTQNVKELKLYHIPESGVSPASAMLLCKVSKEFIFQTPNKTDKTVLDICSEMKVNKHLQSHTFAAIQKVQISIKCKEYMQMIANIGARSFETHWLISWATGTSKALQLSYATNITGALPLGSVAILVKSTEKCICPVSLENVTFGFYKTGHVFCYLPLPIQSGLDFHVNGSFAVTSNRRGLQTNTEDDKYSYESQWNEALLSDAISQSFVNILVKIHQCSSIQYESLSPDYKFYQIWPKGSISVTTFFNRGFYQNLILTDSPVFESYGDWLGLSHCIFLDKTMSQNAEIADIAISTIQKFRPDTRFGVVKLPFAYINELDMNGKWREKAYVVDKQDFYIKYFLPNICDSYWNESKDSINGRNKLLLYCIDHSTPRLDTHLRETECIPTKPDGKLKRPLDLIHPHGRVAKLFDAADKRFPEKAFSSDSILRKLVDLGMMKDALSPDLILERAKTVSVLASNGLYTQALERCNHIMTFLVSCRELDQDLFLELGDIKFLPVLNRPSNWPYQWHADSYFCKQGNSDIIFFEKASSLFFGNCKYIVGCTELLLDSVRLLHTTFSYQLLVNIGVKTEANVSTHTVVEQLLVICRAKVLIQNQVDEIFEKIYSYLDKSASLDYDNLASELRRLENSSVIFLNSDLLPVSKVAFYVGYNCVPELYEIGRNRIGKHRKFLQCVGVKEQFNVQDIVEVLKRKRIEFDNAEIPPDDFRLVHQLLELLADLMCKSSLKYQDITSLGAENIVAPDTEKILRPTNMLCLDDLEFKEFSKSMKFVHSAISRSVAENLGISTKKRKYILDSSIGLCFEQKEELVTRLKGLLDGYPCDIGIMKELIQNADDAYATEIHFVKDFRSHSCRRIFEQSYEDSQSPALLVFNDSPFTQADLKGLKNLGIGSKHKDPAKTGQYGVGFNAVYNLTDLPSFLTKGDEIEGGETLCVFDPLQKFCENTCGMRYVDMLNIRNAFPDVFLGYSEEQLLGGRNIGTIFRFPLRQTKSKLGQAMTQEDLNKILASLKAEMSNILLFLRNITRITVSDISNGTLKKEYSVAIEMSENDLVQRRSFAVRCKERAKQISSNTFSALLQPFHIKYMMQSKDSYNKIQNWMIVQKFGIAEEKVTDEVKNAFAKGNLGMLPVGGVAAKIPTEENQRSVFRLVSSFLWKTGDAFAHDESGKVYCFLPLPIVTGLPMHINGHFVLDHEARRSLYVEEELGYKSAWNYLLLSDNVAYGYVEALKELRSIMFDKDSSLTYAKETFIEEISKFDKYFPVAKKARDKYERFLVKSVYDTIKNNRAELFPISTLVGSTAEGENSQNKYQIIWSSFHPQGHHLPVFCTSSAKSSVIFSLEDLLKTLGLKVTFVTPEIIESTTETNSDCHLQYYDPEIVLQFLKSYSSTYTDRIRIDPLPSPVDETKFSCPKNVERVLYFCSKAMTFKSELNGLPLLVTNDGLLRCFDRSRTTYCTKFCNLFPNSSSQFVHRDLVSQVISLSIGEEYGVKSGAISLECLEVLLSLEVDKFQFTHNDMIPFHSTSETLGWRWIKDLWKCLVYGFRTESESRDDFDFDTYMCPLRHWCLIPAVKDDRETVLARMSRADTVLQMESFKSSHDLEGVLKKLRLPRLDCQCLPDEAVKLLATCLATFENPVALLECLQYYRNAFEAVELTRSDCFTILNFFSDNLPEMQNSRKPEAEWIRKSLRSLPVFMTQEGTYMSVENEDMVVLVLPKGMPSDGIREWALRTNRLLLQENTELTKLYSFLQFSFTTTIEIYLGQLLKSWQYLPVGSTIKHLEYIRDELLSTGLRKQFKSEQKRLIEVLKNMAVIPNDEERKKASDFFSPHNKVFRCFCSPEDFPPAEFHNREWREFLEIIGLKSEVTDSMFIEFAKEVSREGSHTITMQTKRKSYVLSEFLMKSPFKWKPETYKEISHLKFIIPHCAKDKYIEVHKQCTENQNLICFAGSISNRFEDLSWTSLPLLPDEADPYFYSSMLDTSDHIKQKEAVLHINHSPTLDSVLSHCQNVCDSLETCFADENLKDRICVWLSYFMNKLYRYLLHNGISLEKSRQRLRHTPIVYLPDHKKMVPAHQTVITLLQEQEIMPYLVKVPTEYGPYCSLFIHLGAAKSPNFMLYTNVLAQVHGVVQNKVLVDQFMAEWLAISAAVDNLFKNLHASSAAETPPEGTVLYLPTRGRKLMDSSIVIVSDNFEKEKRLGDKVDLHYFIGFRELGLEHRLHLIDRLPKQIRPKYLTSIIREEVDMTEVHEVSGDQQAIQLEHFLQSSNLIENILRLLKHAKTRTSELLLPKEEKQVALNLQKVYVRSVTGLRTYLFIQNERIESSAKHQKSYFYNQDGQWRIYFQAKEDNLQALISALGHDLVRFITSIVGNSLREYGMTIYQLVQMINNQHEISLFLDERGIDAYELPQNILFSVFPPPGTYVPVELHHLLDCGFSGFGVHEYKCVAFELEDNLIFEDFDNSDPYNPVYIYVRIRKKICSDELSSFLTEMYEIDTGDEVEEHIKVPAFRLFKFIRPLSDASSTDLVSTENPKPSVSAQIMNKEKYSIKFILLKAWKLSNKADRKRVIGRLLRKWHPDKNPGNEAFCNELFIYIKECIIELENGGSVDDNETGGHPRQNRAYPDFTHSQYYRFCESMSQRSHLHRAQAQQYYADNTSYYTRYPTTDYTHYASSQRQYPDDIEARRWHRQAKIDLRQACDTIDVPGDPPAFNWICYMCHQATEKSLKAALFAKDANKVKKKSHDIREIAMKIGNGDISRCVADLTMMTGDYAKMRYPDKVDRQHIPSTVYTRQQAERACELARQILNLVEEEFLS